MVLLARHEVLALGSAREALVYLKGSTPDLIVLDVRMPEMDGLALLGRIRMVRRLKEVPVVMLTGGGQEFCEPSSMLGADVFLEKPVSGKKLNEVVEALLSRRGHLLPGGRWSEGDPFAQSPSQRLDGGAYAPDFARTVRPL